MSIPCPKTILNIHKNFIANYVPIIFLDLDDIEKHIADVTARQGAALCKRNPPTTERLANLEQARHRLWNRNSLQADYLELRLGTGEIPPAI